MNGDLLRCCRSWGWSILCNLELDLGCLRGFLNNSLCLSEFVVECLLQLGRQGINDTPVLVEKVGIVPKQACLILECCPALEFAHTSRGLSAMNSLHFLLETFQGQWIVNDCKIVLEASGRKIDEIKEVSISAGGFLACQRTLHNFRITYVPSGFRISSSTIFSCAC